MIGMSPLGLVRSRRAKALALTHKIFRFTGNARRHGCATRQDEHTVSCGHATP